MNKENKLRMLKIPENRWDDLTDDMTDFLFDHFFKHGPRILKEYQLRYLGIQPNKWHLFPDKTVEYMYNQFVESRNQMKKNTRLKQLGIPEKKWDTFSDEAAKLMYEQHINYHSNKNNNKHDKYNNRHKRWSAEQETELINLIKQGVSCNDISEVMERSLIAIRMRLKKIIQDNTELDNIEDVFSYYNIIHNDDKSFFEEHLNYEQRKIEIDDNVLNDFTDKYLRKKDKKDRSSSDYVDIYNLFKDTYKKYNHSDEKFRNYYLNKGYKIKSFKNGSEKLVGMIMK